MPGQKKFIGTVQQKLQRSNIVRHASFRRGNDRRIPSHDVVARKNGVVAVKREDEMVGCVSRRVECGQCPIRPFNDTAIAQIVVGQIIIIDERVAWNCFTDS